MHMLKKPETHDGNRNRGVDMRFYVAPHIVADEVRLKLKDKASQMEKRLFDGASETPAMLLSVPLEQEDSVILALASSGLRAAS